jgi:hypothetical protein
MSNKDSAGIDAISGGDGPFPDMRQKSDSSLTPPCDTEQSPPDDCPMRDGGDSSPTDSGGWPKVDRFGDDEKDERE